MRKFKKALIMVMLAMFLASPGAFAEENNDCEKFDFSEPLHNPLINIILVPVRMVVSLFHLPKCLIHHFPVNEPEEEKDNA